MIGSGKPVSGKESEGMTNRHKHELWKFIGSGSGGQKSYSVYVENGRIVYKTEDEYRAFMCHGDASSTKWISVDALKYRRLRGGDFYEAARAEVERQLQLMKEDDSAAESSTPEAKTAEEVSLKDSSSPNRIPDILPSLASLGDLSPHDQGAFLLIRLAKVFPRSMTFSKADLFWCDVDRPDPYGLAAGIPRQEQRRAVQHFLTYPWREIVHAGYVSKASAGSGEYEVTEKGWALVARNRIEVDWTEIDKLFSENDSVPKSDRAAPPKSVSKRSPTRSFPRRTRAMDLAVKLWSRGF